MLTSLSTHLGLTLEESTDIPTLQRELNKAENNIKELSASKKSKFSDREHKEELKVTLEIKHSSCLGTNYENLKQQ